MNRFRAENIFKQIKLLKCVLFLPIFCCCSAVTAVKPKDFHLQATLRIQCQLYRTIEKPLANAGTSYCLGAFVFVCITFEVRALAKNV